MLDGWFLPAVLRPGRQSNPNHLAENLWKDFVIKVVRNNMENKKLRIIPLGGLGEVGKNMMAYEYDGQILVVDSGMMFPENDMLGIDYIIPDFDYLIERRDQVCGVVITHGHEDHTGAITHLMEEINAPIYATPLTI